ncbi:MAG: hypothetical protein AB1736_01010 [Chloroflexota bacterium]
MDVMQVGATWLHLLATVAMLGYYAVFGLVLLPVIARIVPAAELRAAVVAVEGRAMPLIIGSLIVFLATGIYLMVSDPAYGGLGDVGGSTWATLFLVKHLVVGAMVGVGVVIDALVVRRFAGPRSPDQAAAIRLLVGASGLMTLLGAMVLLLTAAGQAS